MVRGDAPHPPLAPWLPRAHAGGVGALAVGERSGRHRERVRFHMRSTLKYVQSSNISQCCTFKVFVHRVQMQSNTVLYLYLYVVPTLRTVVPSSVVQSWFVRAVGWFVTQTTKVQLHKAIVTNCVVVPSRCGVCGLSCATLHIDIRLQNASRVQ